jgi:hypothetical protein
MNMSLVGYQNAVTRDSTCDSKGRSTPRHQQPEKTDHRPRKVVSVAQSNVTIVPSATWYDTGRTHVGKMAIGHGWNQRSPFQDGGRDRHLETDTLSNTQPVYR